MERDDEDETTAEKKSEGSETKIEMLCWEIFKGGKAIFPRLLILWTSKSDP
jgi:hypothetical protein